MKFEIIEFMKSHPNWEDILTNHPYSLKVSRKDGFVCLKYSQIDSDFSLEIVREARGIILKENTLEVAAIGFDKFFNYGEPNAPKELNYPLFVNEKIDGSLFKVWCDKEQRVWRVSTNSTIDAFDAPLTSVLPGAPKTFGMLFFEAIYGKHYSSVHDMMNCADIDKTYLFEVVSPYNRVVIPYKDIDIYYLGSRNNLTGEYDYTNPFKWMKMPSNITVYSIEALVNVARELPWTKEGYVAWDGINRVKVKSPEYVKAHYLRTNNNLSLSRIIGVVLDNEVDELLTYCDDYADVVKWVQSIMNKYIEDLGNRVSDLDFTLPRKEFAQKVLDLGLDGMPYYAAYAFKMYDEYQKIGAVVSSVEMWVARNLNENKWENIINWYERMEK